MEILGVLNVTRDSFSDGGQYVDPQHAIAHARQLVADGAAIIDVGAQSTRPDAEEVSAEEEISRLAPVVAALRSDGTRVSIDTYRPAVMRAALGWGVEVINDVTALRDDEAVAALRASDCRVILMHSTSSQARAERLDVGPEGIVPRIREFFRERIATLATAGICRQRLILDPGMGLFLSCDPRTSLAVLRNLSTLAGFGLPLCVSTTRKSFLGQVLARGSEARPVGERAAGTLASELWAATQGVQYLRTHDVAALHDAWTVWQAIQGLPARGVQ